MSTEGTALWQRTMAREGPHQDLMREVWGDFPWMVEAYTGSVAEDRYREMVDWCRALFGDDAWPLHDKPGIWCTDSSTIDGWKWFGFMNREDMERFRGAWETRETEDGDS